MQNAIVTMKKLTGYGSYHAMKSPAQEANRATPTETTTAVSGRLVNRTAIAAGVTIIAKIRSTPMTWTAIEMATASRSMKVRLRKRIGKPLASATSSSSEANSRGRYTSTNTASTTRLASRVKSTE